MSSLRSRSTIAIVGDREVRGMRSEIAVENDPEVAGIGRAEFNDLLEHAPTPADSRLLHKMQRFGVESQLN